MAEHLLGNLYQVGGGDLTRPNDAARYLIVDDEKQEHTLVDCGNTDSFEDLTHQVSEVGIEIGRIAVVYATHGHVDHYAGKAFLPNVPLYVHPEDREPILTADPLRTAAFLYGYDTPTEIKTVYPLPEGFETAIGSTYLSSIHTPGHSPGSMCFKIRTKEGVILIGGDTFWGCSDDKLGSDPDRWEESLEKLSHDHFDFVTFGHGISWLVPDAMHHIEKARSHFGRVVRPSFGGLVNDPWASSWEQEIQIIIPSVVKI